MAKSIKSNPERVRSLRSPNRRVPPERVSPAKSSPARVAIPARVEILEREILSIVANPTRASPARVKKPEIPHPDRASQAKLSPARASIRIQVIQKSMNIEDS